MIAIIAAAFDLSFAVGHAAFPKILNWNETLTPSGELNSGITKTINILMVYIFVCYAAALIWYPSQILSWIGVGFLAIRLILQFVLFDMSKPASKGLVGAILIAIPLHLFAA